MASSFADEVDAGDSSHSLLDRRRSELGSQYESGVYMSSFAATVFISALVTIGVLMLTLLVALTVMLNSCERRGSGVIELFKTSDECYYCKSFTFHAELNNLGADEIPTNCRQYSLQYSNEGQFLWDLNLTMQLAESYFSTIKSNDDQLDVIMMDVDDIFLPGIKYHGTSAQDWRHVILEHPACMLVLRLFLKLQGNGWSMMLFTRKHSRYRNETVESLVSAGYNEWSSLIMRSDNELQMESWEYISGIRLQLVEKGYRIASIISSRMDAFQGSNLGIRNFKLANPTYYNFQIPSGHE